MLDLAKACEKYASCLKAKEAIEDLEIFDAFDQVGRYGAAAKFDPMSKGTPLGGFQFYPTSTLQIAGAWVWSSDHLQRLDRIVFNLRRNLRYEAVGCHDNLKSILTNNEKSVLVGTWQGPVPIKSILVRENLYFTDAASP